MSVRHVQALVMGFTQSGKTTLITRWVTGRLPTEDTITMPFNGVKSVHIRSKKHHNKELVVVRFVDGSGLSDHDLRRICLTADVIVACMCVELNGIDEQVIKELNNIFSSRRPPIIVLGTMLDLRYNIQSPPSLNPGDSGTDEENGNTGSADPEDVLTGELTVENVTKHRVSFSVSVESRKGDHGDASVMSEEGQCGENQFARIMTSVSESDGNTDPDVSSISLDIQTSAIRRKNPAFWSTESINGSLVTKLDQSHDSWSEPNIDCTPLNDDGVTDAVVPTVHEEGKPRRLAHTNSATEPETTDLNDLNFSYPKPLLETHFPLNLDIPLTVKHFPKQKKTFIEQKDLQLKCTGVIPFKEDNWFSEDEPDNISFRGISSRITDSRPMAPVANTTTRVPHDDNPARTETEDTIVSDQDKGQVELGLSVVSPSTPPPSVPPEDMNFHVNLDPEPVKLSDYIPEQHQMLCNINGYCRQWSMADGLRLARSVKGDTYMECSACTGQNLQEVFEYIARVGCKYNKKRNEKCSVS